MQTANVLLSIGGHHGNTVPKFGVTAAEIAVLRAIHGDEAVKDVEPGRDVKRSHSQERARLLDIYGSAKSEAGAPIVAGMFPGVAARVHETLAELELPDDFFKATGRMSAGASGAIRHDGPSISEYVAAGYPADTYPPEGFASKSTQEEIDAAIAAQKAARDALAEKFGSAEQTDDADDAGDGIDDMNDDVAEPDDAGKGPDNLFA